MSGPGSRIFDPLAPFWPDRHWRRELFRPWKLLSFAVGMAWLLYGATHYVIGDWDVGISLIMGVLTYLFAPWTVFTIANAVLFRAPYWWLRIAGALVPAVFTVDTVYMLYHTLAGNPIYREANFPASMALYCLCGALWWYRGALADPFRDAVAWHVRQHFSAARESGDSMTRAFSNSSGEIDAGGEPATRTPTDAEIQGALVMILSDGFNRSTGVLRDIGAIDWRKVAPHYKGAGSVYYDLVTDQILLTAMSCTPMIRSLFEAHPSKRADAAEDQAKPD